MQSFNSRPSLQPAQRTTGPTGYGRTGMQLTQRSAGGYHNPANPVDRAMMHNFSDSRPLPSGYRHFSEPTATTPTTTYANSTQAMFASDEPQTPYQQMYHFDTVKNHRDFHFPFRTFMIILVVGALSLGAYAAYRAFTNPSPVNAEYSDGLDVSR